MAALDGVRVIDLTQFEAGPFCGEMLGFLGADVIKLERPGGELGRQSSRRPGDDPRFDAYYFLLLNANKRAVTLDIRSDKGREVFLELCKNSDVLIENLGPGVIERLGFDYETLHALNPRLVFAQIKGFDPDGPYGKYKALNSQGQAMGGVMAITGNSDGPPMSVGPNIADTGSGLHMALGIVAALYQREHTGRGQRIQLAMQEAMINLCRPAFARGLATGRPAARMGNAAPMAGIPTNYYRTAPGGPNDYVMISLQRETTKDWNDIYELIEHPEAGDDPRFADNKQRLAHAVELHELIESWTGQRSKMEVMQKMQAIGIPAGAVLDSDDLSSDPFLRKNGMFVEIEHSQRGPVVVPGLPMRLSDSPVVVRPAPLLGEHTREVLGDILGLTSAELDDLESSGVTKASS